MQIISDRAIERLRMAHRSVKYGTIKAVAEQMILAGEHAVAHVQAYPAFKPDTRHLQLSTDWRVVKLSNGRILKIRNTAKYASAIDRGADAHPIVARRAPYLHFFWKRKGRWVKTKEVRHPGNRPYKFLYRASNSAGRVFFQGLEAQMKKLARNF